MLTKGERTLKNNPLATLMDFGILYVALWVFGSAPTALQCVWIFIACAVLEELVDISSALQKLVRK